MGKSNQSLLFENTARRMRLIYKTALQQIEQHFPDIVRNNAWSVARYNILNVGNDQTRLLKSDLESYCVYKHVAINDVDHKIHATPAGLSVIRSTEFGWTTTSKPFACLTCNRSEVLDELSSDLGVGIVFQEDSKWVYYIVGVRDCISSFKLFDKVIWGRETHQKYTKWRSEVSSQYIGGDW